MQDNAATDSVDEEQLVTWKNPPKLADLKQDLLEATPFKQAQVERIDGWLENLRGEGKAVPKTGPNSSKIVPKLIRKQAE